MRLNHMAKSVESSQRDCTRSCAAEALADTSTPKLATGRKIDPSARRFGVGELRACSMEEMVDLHKPGDRIRFFDLTTSSGRSRCCCSKWHESPPWE
jgi:hypothetical protein